MGSTTLGINRGYDKVKDAGGIESYHLSPHSTSNIAQGLSQDCTIIESLSKILETTKPYAEGLSAPTGLQNLGSARLSNTPLFSLVPGGI